MWSIAQELLSLILNILPVLKHLLSKRLNRSSKSILSFVPTSNKSAIRLFAADSCSCSFVLLRLRFVLITALQLRHSICFSSGPHPTCLLNARDGSFLPQVL